MSGGSSGARLGRQSGSTAWQNLQLFSSLRRGVVGCKSAVFAGMIVGVAQEHALKGQAMLLVWCSELPLMG
jgi:hypothetical protein